MIDSINSLVGEENIKSLMTPNGSVDFILPNPDNIPLIMREMRYAYWIAEQRKNSNGDPAYKHNGKPKINKAPINKCKMKVSKNMPEQWLSFDDCISGFDRDQFFGYGPLMCADYGIVGVDLDDYDDLISAMPEIENLISQAKKMGIYCELSPSGTGRRLFVKAKLPADKGRRKGGIELYTDTAFLTITGAMCWKGDVVDGQWLVDQLMKMIGGNKTSHAPSADKIEKSAAQLDNFMVDKMAELMVVKQPKLWRGDWQPDGGNLNPEYASQSEADFALCGHIMRAVAKEGVCKSDAADVIYSVFSRSGLYRPEKDKTLTAHTIPNILRDYAETRLSAVASSRDEVRQLPPILKPAPELDLDLIPASIRPFVEDVSRRMQLPPEIILTPLLISFGSVIGKKVAIQPHGHDPSWSEYPNLWGLTILEPGMLKSPALSQSMKFINELDETARSEYNSAIESWGRDDAMRKIIQKGEEDKIKSLHKSGKLQEAKTLAESLLSDKKPPIRKRYVVTDATPEARLKILSENPQGLMLIRDELSGHIEQLHRDGYESARSQELQFYDGKMNYEDDRVKRDGIYAVAPRMALYGNLQPSKVEALLLDRSKSGRGKDDGYIERLFQLAIMPVLSKEYKVNKSPPDEAAEARVRKLFRKADTLTVVEDDSSNGGCRVIKFTPEAQELFDNWLSILEGSLRNQNNKSVMKSHKGKYRGTVTKLALLMELCEDVNANSVSIISLRKALKLVSFYRAHAQRVYELGEPSDLASAYVLLHYIENGVVKDGFAPRDVQKRKLRRLESLGEVEGAIVVLEEHGYVQVEELQPPKGRPSKIVHINPTVLAKVKARSA